MFKAEALILKLLTDNKIVLQYLTPPLQYRTNTEEPLKTHHFKNCLDNECTMFN